MGKVGVVWGVASGAGVINQRDGNYMYMYMYGTTWNIIVYVNSCDEKKWCSQVKSWCSGVINTHYLFHITQGKVINVQPGFFEWSK